MLDKAIDAGTESAVIAEVLRDSLLDIAQRNNRSEDVIRRIEDAFEQIADSHFVREERIAKLSHLLIWYVIWYKRRNGI